MTVLLPKLFTRDLPGALDWIDRFVAMAERGELGALLSDDTAAETAGFTVVSSGVLGNAAFDPAAAGAQLLDIILFCDPANAGTYDGSGWTTGTYAWPAHGYTAAWRWKQLNSLGAITRSAGGYAASWVILRGPTTLALVDGQGTAPGPSTLTLTMPALNASHMGHIVFAADRDATNVVTSPTDWTQIAADTDGVFAKMLWQRTPSVEGAVTFTDFLTTYGQMGFAFEARS